jgi:hypothetical protein
MLYRVKRAINWLLQKAPELKHLSVADALLAKVVMDIQRESKEKKTISVALISVYQIHPINRETALKKIEDRMQKIAANKEAIIKNNNHISNDILIQTMPSVTPIRVVTYKEGYIAFEGNGRVVALKKAFPDTPFTLEVEHYILDKDSRIYTDLDKLQKLYQTS